MPKVYWFTMYDINDDQVVGSKCMATEQFIAKVGGAIEQEGAIEVDAGQLDENGRHYPPE